MRILGIDSSGLVASVALLTDGCLTAEYTIHYKKTHSQTLLPMLDEILRMCEAEPSELDAIAVAAGPGSLPGFGSALLQQKAWRRLGGNRLYRCRRRQGLPIICSARQV